jgi:hypothetical protein
LNGWGRLLVRVAGGHCVLHHYSTTLGRGHIVGSLVCCGVGSKAQTAGSHGQTRAVVAERMEEGGSVVDGWRGGARRWSLSACGTGKNGLVHAVHGAAPGVGMCCRALVVFSWAGACCAGVVVVHIMVAWGGLRCRYRIRHHLCHRHRCSRRRHRRSCSGGCHHCSLCRRRSRSGCHRCSYHHHHCSHCHRSRHDHRCCHRVVVHGRVRHVGALDS